jgi:hypothetical protein
VIGAKVFGSHMVSVMAIFALMLDASGKGGGTICESGAGEGWLFTGAFGDDRWGWNACLGGQEADYGEAMKHDLGMAVRAFGLRIGIAAYRGGSVGEVR